MADPGYGPEGEETLMLSEDKAIASLLWRIVLLHE